MPHRVCSIRIRIKTHPLHSKQGSALSHRVYSIRIRIKTSYLYILYQVSYISRRSYSIRIRIKTFKDVKILTYLRPLKSIFH